MQLTIGDTWIDDLVTSEAVARAGTGNAFYRAARAGRFVTLSRGVHLPSHVWERLDPDARFRARIHAVSVASRTPMLFSHLSAAAMWRLPMVGPWPLKPEVLTEPSGGGKSRAACRVHGTGKPPSSDVIDGLEVTHLARTVADVARTALLGTAVAMADAALSSEVAASRHGCFITPDDLVAELRSGSQSVGRVRLERVLNMADGRSGSPGESVSRVAMHLEGLPRPVLQQRFVDRDGLVGVVDFWWPEFSLIGEFDGDGKYTREEMLRGRSPAEAVIAEKVREDRLRALGPRVARWRWEAAISPPRLGRLLRSFGLPSTSRRGDERISVR